MSTKTYCDKCGKQTTAKDHNRLRSKLGRFEIETIVCVNGVWNAGHICNRCIKEIVTTGQVIAPKYGA